MMWNTRRAVGLFTVVALLLSAALVQPALGQKMVRPPIKFPPQPPGIDPTTPAQPKDPTEFNDSITLPKDPRLSSRLVAAREYIDIKDWVEATNILQILVTLPSDVFTRQATKSPDGKETMMWVSVKTQANKLLSTLPPEGKKYYQTTYGPEALGKLVEAKKTSNPELLADVMRRFLYTDAGAEATNLLATHLLDRGNYAMSAICFGRLIDREGPEKVAPLTLFKAAYAFHQAGDKDNESRAWRELRLRTRELKIGNDFKSVEELQQYVAALTKASGAQNQSNWAMFGGNAARNGLGDGDTAYLVKPDWKVATAENGPFIAKLNSAMDELNKTQQAILPAFSPVTAVITSPKDGRRIPLIVFRTHKGLFAYDTSLNKRYWETPMEWSSERMLGDLKYSATANQWMEYYCNQVKRPNILFENSTIGTLSTDGTNIFAVDDIAVPPPTQPTGFDEGMIGRFPQQQPNFATQDKKLQNALKRSVLKAYSLYSGKFLWQAPAAGNEDNDKDELSNSIFLGPPLPLAGKLYVLTEKNQDLRLVCLDPAGKLLQVQQLASTRDKVQADVSRRVQAAHLSYGEGMLVCPTNAGAVLGIDLLTNSLVWAFSYREKVDGAPKEEPPPDPLQGRFRRGGMPYQPNYYVPNKSIWKVSAPIIQDGKVVFVAPDGQRIYCLNLRDGSRVWDQHRAEDDLYLAGVYNGKVVVVNKNHVRAYELATGEAAWGGRRIETGLPSGQGIASGDIYYLPLKANKDKMPEIFAIDMENGRPNGHARAHKAEDIPGNLLFFEGRVISQGVKEVTAYSQVRTKLAEIDQRIKATPDDPVVLADRGDLRLDRGDLPGAVQDFSTALKKDPPFELRTKARTKLFETLTEYLQRDFNRAETYLEEYEKLCTVEIPDSITHQEKELLQAESRRRRANYLFLVAKGRESQRKLVEAFEKYQEFGAVAGGTSELFTVIDEPTVKAAPDVFAQGRIKAMVDNATPAERAPLEELIAARWKNVKAKNDPAELRKFVAVFGNLFTVGKEARLRLAEKLMESNEPSALLDAERHLTILRGRNESSEMAGRAVEALARLNTKRGLLDDAAYYYEILNREYGNVQIRDGKTGADIFNELATDKRLLPLLDRTRRMNLSKIIKAAEVSGSFPVTQLYVFEQAGEALPFFQRSQVALRFDTHTLKITDRATREDRLSQSLPHTQFQNLVGQAGAQARFTYLNLGHLVVLPLGNMIFGIDSVNQKLLWKVNLHEPISALGTGNDSASAPNFTRDNNSRFDPRDNSFVVVYSSGGGWKQRVGGTGPLEGSVICLQARDGLRAIDPLTGRVLWTRSDIGPRSAIFGDTENVYIVEMDNEDRPAEARAVRASDGVSVRGVRNFANLYGKPTTRLIGRTLLVQESAPAGGLLLRQYDVLTGRDIWSETLPSGFVQAKTEDPNLVAAFNPADGRIRAFDLRSKKEVLSTRLTDAKFYSGAQNMTLLRDFHSFYAAFTRAHDPQVIAYPNVLPNAGLRTVPVDGWLCAFALDTGKLRWGHDAHSQDPRQTRPPQDIVLDQFEDLPVILMTTHFHLMPNGPNGPQTELWTARSLNKTTGKMVFDGSSDSSRQVGTKYEIPKQYFYSVVANPQIGRVEFIGPQLKIVHQLQPEGLK